MRIGRGGNGTQRYLATVLFVDIAGSTELAADIGDAAWKALLQRHYAALRDRLRRHGGRQIDTAGDGLFAAFPTPAEAVACALEMMEADAAIGIAIRCGIHTGEVQRIEGKAGGLAVHIGARVAALAEPGQVLVSSTVKDMAAGSGFRFDPRGEVALKGVPGEWRLFAVRPPFAVPATGDDVTASASARTASATATRDAGAPRTSPVPLRLAAAFGGSLALLAAIVLVSNTLLAGATAARPSPAGPSPSIQPSSVPVAANSVSRMTAAGIVEASATVGRSPSGMAIGDDGSIWVANATDGSVSRVDPTSSAVTETIHDVGADPAAIVAAFGAIWVANSGERTVARIDPTVDRVVRTYTVGNAPSGIASDGTSIWVADRLDGRIARIDPASTDGDIASFPVALAPADVAFAGGSLWVSDSDAGTVVRVDPASGAIIGAPIHVGNGSSALAATAQAVWVANRLDGTVSQVDPAQGKVVATIPVDGAPFDLAATTDAVWVAVPTAGELIDIDPRTEAVAARVHLPVAPRAVVIGGDQPVFASGASQGAHRGGTIRIAADEKISTPGSPDASAIPDGDVGPLLMPYVYDTLVGYRRTGGPGADDLVPDLATSIPGSPDGGATWTFQLRSGIRYSDGSPLRASDVRRSVERAVAQASCDGCAPFISAVGAAACTATTCDLGKGIEVDDATGTVTFHLSPPDPRFALDIAGLYIVPAGSSLAASKTPLPGTGPYRFESFAEQRVVLARNPDFQVWSPDAQPDGYPDEIDWETVADPMGAVEAGTADVLDADLSSDQLQRLETTAAAQLSISPSMETWFEMMNTRIPPFDDVHVRQAVDFAVDRAKVAAAYGGGLVTCQVVQPGFAGYEPYCPYTLGGDTGGTWRGPDPSRAASLIPARDRGMHVTVAGLDDPSHAAVARYFVALLDSLGFKAELKLLDIDGMFGIQGIAARPTDIQMAGYWIQIQAPAASAMFPGAFTCADYHGPPVGQSRYPQDFCDHALDARITQALKDESSADPSVRASAESEWAAIDRTVVDLAPAVVPFNVPAIDFVSRRVGNYQHHRVLGMLLDQLWVDGLG